MSLSRRAVILTLCLGPFVGACDDSKEAPLRDRPALTEDSVVRMMDAMRALREKAREVLAARGPQPDAAAAVNPQPHLAGVGLTGLVGEAQALPIVERFGFVSITDYESTVAYTQQALARVLLGPDGGVGGMGKANRLEAELRALNDTLDTVERGGTPTDASEPPDIDHLRRRISEIEDQLATQDHAVAAMKAQNSEIPRSSLDAVGKYRDELMKLFTGQ